jgi:hypothetical protein
MQYPSGNGGIWPEVAGSELTAEELRSISGGRDISLNIEIEKRSKADGDFHHRSSHGKR